MRNPPSWLIDSSLPSRRFREEGRQISAVQRFSAATIQVLLRHGRVKSRVLPKTSYLFDCERATYMVIIAAHLRKEDAGFAFLHRHKAGGIPAHTL